MPPDVDPDAPPAPEREPGSVPSGEPPAGDPPPTAPPERV
jgi:hypothetical protein